MEDGVALQIGDDADLVAIGELFPVEVVGLAGAGDERRGEQLRVDDPGDGGDVPDDFGPGVVGGLAFGFGLFVFEELGEEVVAQAGATFHVALEFGDGSAEALGTIAGGDLDEGDAAVEENSGGMEVLLQIEFGGGGGVVGGASEPDHDDVVFDSGFEKNGGGDVGGGSEGDDVEGLLAWLEGATDQVTGGGRVDRFGGGFEEAGGAAEGELFRVATEDFEDAVEFFVALLHAVGGAGGAGVEIRSGVGSFDFHAVGGKNGEGDGVLVVYFVVSVGVEDDLDLFGGGSRRVEVGAGVWAARRVVTVVAPARSWRRVGLRGGMAG